VSTLIAKKLIYHLYVSKIGDQSFYNE
jgi:hypothetical protein